MRKRNAFISSNDAAETLHSELFCDETIYLKFRQPSIMSIHDSVQRLARRWSRASSFKSKVRAGECASGTVAEWRDVCGGVREAV